MTMNNKINENVTLGFNLDKNATEYMLSVMGNYRKVTEKNEQRKYGDVCSSKGQYIDFKFDQYDNRNVGIEETQVCGYGWLDELDDETTIMWIKVANGYYCYAKVKDIREFKKTTKYAIRKLNTAYTGTTFKNFSFDEIVSNVKNAHTGKLPENMWNNRPDSIKLSKSSWSDSDLYKNITKEEYLEQCAKDYDSIK